MFTSRVFQSSNSKRVISSLTQLNLINVIHPSGGGGGGSASGSSRQGGHAQRAADQFAQAHRVEAVDKGQLESSSNDRGEHSVMFTHHHRDAEVLSDSHVFPSLLNGWWWGSLYWLSSRVLHLGTCFV